MSSIFICPACAAENKKSEVKAVSGGYVDYWHKYWNEQGKRHEHCCKSATIFRCTNGHRLRYITLYDCPTCGSMDAVVQMARHWWSFWKAVDLNVLAATAPRSIKRKNKKGKK